jgi:hypothetical protein
MEFAAGTGECGHGFFSGGSGAGNGGVGAAGGSDGNVPAVGAGGCGSFNGPFTPHPESGAATSAIAAANVQAARCRRRMKALGIKRES